ncbi:TetR/AcrR family transcriptional regulator [Mycolicibacterium baixiangningiae]|uniref:TetR/AcrR family transcriptional regulator n=1 Tax=Mycolicibacterium baixiangningiae TaxID=2761578 RepID=UPI0018D1A480|nr:TetR/AcrR family transcriptional regulator [Mycolicibacterium baixiangningiae]
MPAATDTSQDILRCARTLIIVGGYNGFSYADIAAVVGIRKASIHHHFPTKVDLVRTLLQQYRQEVDAGIAEFERQSANPVDQLSGYIGYWEGCIGDPTSSYCVCALLASQLPVLPPEIAQELQSYFRGLSDWLTSLLDRGAKSAAMVLSADARVEAETFMATVHGAMLAARAYGDPTAFGMITRPLLARLTADR